MNYVTSQKISNLIEESIMGQIKKLLQGIGTIPKKILDRIKQKYRATSLEEAQTPAPKIEGKTDYRDTCYTSVMKLINKDPLIKKYNDLDAFIDAYRIKNKDKIYLNKVDIKDLKPGTIIYHEYLEPGVATINRSFGKFGLEQEENVTVGHLEIYLGVDPKRNKDKHAILGNAYPAADRPNIGTMQELTLDYKTDSEMKKPLNPKYWLFPEALDYNTIKTM